MKKIAMLTLVFGLGLCGIREALMAGGCELFWPSTDPTTTTADGFGNFNFTLHTSGSSWSNGVGSPPKWTLYQQMSGSGVSNLAAAPSSVDIVETSGIAVFTAGSAIQTTCSGSGTGTATLNVWDGTNFQCSAAKPVTVN